MSKPETPLSQSPATLRSPSHSSRIIEGARTIGAVLGSATALSGVAELLFPSTEPLAAKIGQVVGGTLVALACAGTPEAPQPAPELRSIQVERV